MIVGIAGELVEKKELSVVIRAQGLYYEVMVPASVLNRLDEAKDEKGQTYLITYHYVQLTPSSGAPVLIGFMNEVEKDFFQQFIKVSGIGPKAAVKALNQPIAQIIRAIDSGDAAYLKTLPGIGMQRAKEIVAKLQGKVGKFGLIKDEGDDFSKTSVVEYDWQQEALNVLLQLQYKRHEASVMIDRALETNKSIKSAEELLNEIYKQRVKI